MKQKLQIMITKLSQEFDNEFKKTMYQSLKEQLTGVFTGPACEDFMLLGNHRVGSFVYDAILLTNTDLFVFQFMHNLAGKISVNDEGWRYSTGEIIQSGSHDETTPWELVREKRNVLFGIFRKKGLRLFIKTILLFEEPFELVKGSTVLNLENHKWFLTAQKNNVISVIRTYSSSWAPVNFLKMVRPVFQVTQAKHAVGMVAQLCSEMIRWWKKIA